MEHLSRHDLMHDDGRRVFIYGSYGGQELVPLAPSPEPPALHMRFDALTDRWVAISPARNARPQSGADAADERAACPLCVGGPELPFDYEAAVFENRFPTMLPDPPPPPALGFPTAPARGRCEVVCYTPTHTGSLATLATRELARVIAIWIDRSTALWAEPAHRYVLVFENRGEDVGATLSHPHGQIYALDHVPALAQARTRALADHRARTDSCLSCAVVEGDAAAPERSLADNPSFTVSVPFAPNWPYEVHVRARRHGLARLSDLTPAERRDLAVALRDVVHRYDRLHVAGSLAYMMVCQQAPDDGAGAPARDWHLSFEFLPPSRGPDKLKVRASVETAAGFFINDTLPEESAAQLRGVGSLPPEAGAEIPDVEVVPAGVAVTPTGRPSPEPIPRPAGTER